MCLFEVDTKSMEQCVIVCNVHIYQSLTFIIECSFIYSACHTYVKKQVGIKFASTRDKERVPVSSPHCRRLILTPLFPCLLVYKRWCTSKSHSIAGALWRQWLWFVCSIGAGIEALFPIRYQTDTGGIGRYRVPNASIGLTLVITTSYTTSLLHFIWRKQKIALRGSVSDK